MVTRAGRSAVWLACAYLIPMSVLGAEPGPGLSRFEFDETHMGSTFHIVLYCADDATARRASRAAFERVAELDATLSDYKPESELMRLCRAAGGPPVPVGADLFRVLELSRRMYERSGGAFDVTVAPVVRLWRRARRERKLPDPELLARALALVGSDAMRLDAEKRTVELRKPGMKLDVGGIAKGYAAGEAIATLKRHGIDRALVAAAGDIVVSGAPPDADGWTVAIAPLESPRAEPSVYLSLEDAAISTSGRRRAVRRDRRQALFPHRRPPDRPGRGRPLQRHRRRDRRRDRRQPGHGRLRPRTRARHGPRRRDPGRLGPDRTLDPRGHSDLRVEPLPRNSPVPAPSPLPDRTSPRSCPKALTDPRRLPLRRLLAPRSLDPGLTAGRLSRAPKTWSLPNSGLQIAAIPSRGNSSQESGRRDRPGPFTVQRDQFFKDVRLPAGNRRETQVHFRPVPHRSFEGSAPRPNMLRLQMDPDRIALTVNIERARGFLRPGVHSISLPGSPSRTCSRMPACRSRSWQGTSRCRSGETRRRSRGGSRSRSSRPGPRARSSCRMNQRARTLR